MKTFSCFLLLSILQLVSLKIEEVDLDPQVNTLQIAARERNLGANNNFVINEEENFHEKHKSDNLEAPKFHKVNSTDNLICTTSLQVAASKVPQIEEMQYPFQDYMNKEKLSQGKPFFNLEKVISHLHPALLKYIAMIISRNRLQIKRKYNLLQPLYSRSKRSNTVKTTVHKNGDALHFDVDMVRADATKTRFKLYVVDHRDSQGFTPLYQALVNDHTGIAEQLVSAGADLNRKFLVQKRNLLHEAARFGAVKSIRWLVEKGLGVNSTDDVGRLPLHYAVINRQINATKTLIDLKSCLDCRNSQGFTPLYEALLKGDVNIAAVLVKEGADVHQTISSSHRSLLHEAASLGIVESMRWLVNNGLSVNATDDDKWTPLHYPAYNGRFTATTTLLHLKCCIDCRDSAQSTALYKALSVNNVNMAAILVKAGPDLQQKFFKDRRNLLHEAARLGAGVSVTWLGTNGICINATDDDKWTPLHYAAYNGIFSSTIALINLKCCIDCRNSAGYTALYKALEINNTIIADLLVKAGADLHQTFSTGRRNLLHEAARMGAVNSIRWLVKNGISVNSTEDFTWMPLHFAARNGKLNATKVLIELNSCVDCKSSAGFTPLRYAEMNHHQDVAKFLKSI